ncbi:hypothetical protein DSO57_1018444 [Entomophthora muscae]|uniref:Uncharacterized protein n=1 Tax=Entomophthora muscae TaxID=34485 RepID=A0ACC2UP44_9FUNG|nr:hypothetical protein DSO57_1018444 [Entomophthora muscae]
MRRNPWLPMYMYLPSLSSPLPPEDPGAPSCVSSSKTALTLGLAGPKVPQTSSPSLGSTEPDASPLLFYPDSQEIGKPASYSSYYQCSPQRQKSKEGPLTTPEAWEAVALPYTKQLTLPTTKAVHESDSA